MCNFKVYYYKLLFVFLSAGRLLNDFGALKLFELLHLPINIQLLRYVNESNDSGLSLLGVVDGQQQTHVATPRLVFDRIDQLEMNHVAHPSS